MYAEVGGPVEDDVIPEFSDDEDILSPMTAETLVGLISEEDDAIAELQDKVKEHTQNKALWTKKLTTLIKAGECVEGEEDANGLKPIYGLKRTASFKRAGKGGNLTPDQVAAFQAKGIDVNTTINMAKVGAEIRAKCPKVDDTLEIEAVRQMFGETIMGTIEITHSEKLVKVKPDDVEDWKLYGGGSQE